VIRVSAAIITMIILGGCAQTYTWVKLGSSTADFYRAKSHCEAISTGATPMDYSNPGSSTTYHSGSAYGSGGQYGTYSGTSTTYNDNMAQTFANLGQAVRRKGMFNDCMRGQGFLPQQEKSSSSVGKAESIASPSSSSHSSLNGESEWEESAVDYDKGTVSFDNTRLLSQPNSNAKQLDVIAKGEEVEVIAEAGSFWFKVRYKWQQGYVMQPWVTPIIKSSAAKEASN